MSNRMVVVLLAVLCATAASGVISTVAAQAPASDAEWEVPRTNRTMTPIQREEGQGPV